MKIVNNFFLLFEISYRIFNSSNWIALSKENCVCRCIKDAKWVLIKQMIFEMNFSASHTLWFTNSLVHRWKILSFFLHKPTSLSYYEKFCIVFINFEFVFFLLKLIVAGVFTYTYRDGWQWREEREAYYETYWQIC